MSYVALFVGYLYVNGHRPGQIYHLWKFTLGGP